MTKKAIKKVTPVLLGLLIIAMVVSVFPSNVYADKVKGVKPSKDKKVETKVENKKVENKTVEYIKLSEAEEIALKKVKNKKAEVTDYEIQLTYKDPHYKIEVTIDNGNLIKVSTVKIDGITGKVKDVNTEKIKVNKDNKVKTNNGRFISKYEAKMIALNEVDSRTGFITGFEIELEKETPHYLVEVRTSSYRYVIKVEAETGNVLDTKKYVRESNDGYYYEEDYKIKGNSDKINKDKEKYAPVVKVKFISEEKAIEIALAKIGKTAKLDKIKLEKDDNPPKYEVEMYDDKYEYEIEIHAITGAVLKFERD